MVRRLFIQAISVLDTNQEKRLTTTAKKIVAPSVVPRPINTPRSSAFGKEFDFEISSSSSSIDSFKRPKSVAFLGLDFLVVFLVVSLDIKVARTSILYECALLKKWCGSFWRDYF